MIKSIKRQLFKPKLSQEAFTAYFHRLPDSIEVNWHREGKFIVGRVAADGKKFMTQGLNVDEFVEMVNDAVITVFDIPEDYINVINKSKAYLPTAEEYKRLNDNKISHSSFGSRKRESVQALA